MRAPVRARHLHARPSRAALLGAAALVVAVLAVPAGGALATGIGTRPDPVASAQGPAEPPRTGPAQARQSADAPGPAAAEAEPVRARPVLAEVSGVGMALPPGAVHAGFHQSSSRTALALGPAQGHSLLPSRGRGTSRSSAVDIAMTPETPVASTVTGTVVRAEPYRLYGRYDDLLVVVRPDDEPGIEVRHLHLDATLVQPGDRVEAGVTPIATAARQLPIASQIDRITGRGPHVHVEARPAA